MPMNETSDYVTGDPPVASYARKRLDDAWYLWEAFGEPPVIWRLRERVKAGEAWLAEHTADDPQYGAAQRGLERLRAALAETEADPHEARRWALWNRLEAEFLSAEADYISIVGRPVVVEYAEA